MEIIRRGEVGVLENSGISSRQLLSPENSESSRVTITRVAIPPGAINPRHRHASSEQVWVALAGQGRLLLADDKSILFQAGDIARFADGDVHGFHNTGTVPFEYLSVTSPPIDFRPAYAAQWPAK